MTPSIGGTDGDVSITARACQPRFSYLEPPPSISRGPPPFWKSSPASPESRISDSRISPFCLSFFVLPSSRDLGSPHTWKSNSLEQPEPFVRHECHVVSIACRLAMVFPETRSSRSQPFFVRLQVLGRCERVPTRWTRRIRRERERSRLALDPWYPQSSS